MGRRVQRIDRQLINALVAVQAAAAADAQRRLLAGLGLSGPPPAVPRALLAKVARLLAQLAALGQADLAGEIDKAVARRRFALPRIAEGDAAEYARRAETVADYLTESQWGTLRDTVTQGQRDGLSDQAVANRIADEASLGLKTWEAKVWARTEATRFYSIGRHNALSAAGDLVWGFEYVVIEDNRTTDVCRNLLGKRVPTSQPVPLPPYHFQCRTTLRAVLAESITGQAEQPAGTELDRSELPADGFDLEPRRQTASWPPPTGGRWPKRPRVRDIASTDWPGGKAPDTLAGQPPKPPKPPKPPQRRTARGARLPNDDEVYKAKLARVPVPAEIEALRQPGDAGHLGADGNPPWHPLEVLPDKIPPGLAEHLTGLGYDTPQAQHDLVDLMQRWTYGSWKPGDADVALVNEYVERAAAKQPFSRRVMRSIRLDPDPATGEPDLGRFNGAEQGLEVGTGFTLDKPSSWTSGGARWGNVWFVVREPKGCASVRGMANARYWWQDEAVSQADARYTVVKRTLTTVLDKQRRSTVKAWVFELEQQDG